MTNVFYITLNFYYYFLYNRLNVNFTRNENYPKYTLCVVSGYPLEILKNV